MCILYSEKRHIQPVLIRSLTQKQDSLYHSMIIEIYFNTIIILMGEISENIICNDDTKHKFNKFYDDQECIGKKFVMERITH